MTSLTSTTSLSVVGRENSRSSSNNAGDAADFFFDHLQIARSSGCLVAL